MPLLWQEIYTYPRPCLILTVKDDSGSLNAIAMGDKAEKLIGINVRRLYEADRENVRLVDRVASDLEGRVMLCYVKLSARVVRAVKGAPYTIITAYDLTKAERNSD